MTHAAPTTNALHVHSITPCTGDTPVKGSTTVKPGVCTATDIDCTVNTFWEAGWTKPASGVETNGGIYGLAKDGHVIYGPYNTAGELWSCDDVDACNGWWPDAATGEYAYASTTFFPYTVGCWGPAGPSGTGKLTIPAGPTCSTNGCPEGGSLSGINFSYLVTAGLIMLNVLF